MKIQHNLLAAVPNRLRGAATRSLRRVSLSCLAQVQVVINTLRTVSFKLFKRPFPGVLTILTL